MRRPPRSADPESLLPPPPSPSRSPAPESLSSVASASFRRACAISLAACALVALAKLPHRVPPTRHGGLGCPPLPRVELTRGWVAGPSPVHGLGAFASRPLGRGDAIGAPVSRLLGVPYFGELGRGINHCERDANAALVYCEGEYKLVATEPMKEEEEITVDYRYVPWFGTPPAPWWKAC
ncbi:hypothetical protein TeGR_g5368 [Tetraparma gracilis]|uniref:SET domain-containing protein n=1 Tax=Tetraparma gracilis TaxID=2962635 RepID=A0ABQ6NDH2_9STRA|nr:hypothetical protein TeGR_g5368 [Tetraparma gracilis]